MPAQYIYYMYSAGICAKTGKKYRVTLKNSTDAVWSVCTFFQLWKDGKALRLLFKLISPAHASNKKCNYNNFHFLPETEKPSKLEGGLDIEVTLTNTNGGIQKNMIQKDSLKLWNNVETHKLLKSSIYKRFWRCYVLLTWKKNSWRMKLIIDYMERKQNICLNSFANLCERFGQRK